MNGLQEVLYVLKIYPKLCVCLPITGRGSSVSNSFPKALRLRSTLKELIPRRLDTRKLTYQDIHSGTWTGVEDAY